MNVTLLRFVPDPMKWYDGPYCYAKAGGYICTRCPGHLGRHAASNGEHITAVWS